ncbi:MAG: IPT/TIG domain-containing protein [Terracidiphilus sp.]
MFTSRFAIVILAAAIATPAAPAGGPKYVAGTAYFNPAVWGQSVHWSGGVVNYYVDQGPLNGQIDNQQATTMVDMAAALWSSVPTAGVRLMNSGSLNEDVSGSSVMAGNRVFAAPSDVTPSATSYPLAVIYDVDGSVINSLFGAGASDPTSCQNNGVFPWIDNIQPDATIAHAAILLNGLCATNANLIAMMQYELARAFGRILGLDYAQVNPRALSDGEPNGTLGWPIMQPMSGFCGAAGGTCLPDPGHLRYDDIAALNRIYPITVSNIAGFPGKQITAANTVSIQGTLAFRSGAGMQGVNVVARPLDGNGNPLYEYTVTFVSGAYFSGNHGNPITGWTDANGIAFAQWGSNDPTLQGFFDLSGIPLPPGMSTADYQVTIETISPLYMLAESVGPYVEGSPTPSGTMPVISVPQMSVGSAQTLTVLIPDSAAGNAVDAISSADLPRTLAPSGLWCGRLSQVGQTDWFSFPVRGGHTFTIVTQALNEAGLPTESKALPAIGVWDAFKPLSAISLDWAPALNGYATGETWLQVTASADDIVRLGIADMRGDGRPDYAYNGWVLYADTVQPPRLPLSGGPIVIHGMGFRPSDFVMVGGQRAVVTSISPNEITAIAPAARPGTTGSVDVEVDDLPMFYAITILSGGISYDAATGDSLTIDTAPANNIPIGVPIPFTVTALGPDLVPAGGVTVTFSVISGNATLACGASVCSIAATGDGMASMNITAPDSVASVVSASLANGATLQAHFTGGTPPTLASLTPPLSVAAGAKISWTTQTLALSNGVPTAGQTVAWQASSNIAVTGTSSSITGANGIASKTLAVGPLAEGQQTTSTACINGTSQCVSFVVLGARPEFAWLEAVSGSAQSLSTSDTPGMITLRVRDMNGNPMAAGTVNLYQSLYAWTPPCLTHGRCAQAPLIATQVATATSALDGTVFFAPASIPGVPTNLVALAVTGNSSALTISVEQHP